jgi:pilus assembly protein CpaF
MEGVWGFWRSRAGGARSRTAGSPPDRSAGSATAAPVDAVEPSAAPAAQERPAPLRLQDTPERIAALAGAAARVHDELYSALDLRRSEVDRLDDAQLRELVRTLIADILVRIELPPDVERVRLARYVLDEAVGLGPLERLLADDGVTEVMANGPADVFVERGGRIERAPVAFSTVKAMRSVIERIVTPLGRRVDESSPLVDARLPDGSRVNVVIPPLSVRGPTITIRKFARRRLETSDLLRYGSLSPAMLEFLTVCIRHRRNVIVSGGTGSGKTTLLNVLSNLVPPEERIVTIEDAAELQLCHENVVTLEARPRNVEGRGEVTIRDLVRNSLRMRPDRIIVGECRGGEALDMLQAMNTGHDGSLTTAHANSPRDLLSRLEVMVLMAGLELPIAAVREQIASGLHVVVQQTRFPCGARKITQIVEITGLESTTIQTQDVFRYVRTGTSRDGRVLGQFVACGYVPAFYEELRRAGVPLDLSPFVDGVPDAFPGT